MAMNAAFKENPLLVGLEPVQAQIVRLKERAKKFYFHVVLNIFRCPKCNGKLQMTGVSQCSCKHGHTLDPTLVFQKSSCCNAPMIRKTFHYVCSRCKRINPSRFLFGERIFDSSYFSQMMKKHRERNQLRKETIIRQMQESRSNELTLLEVPDIESLPGLVEDLDLLVRQGKAGPEDKDLGLASAFSMTKYRCHILSALECGSRFFSGISCLTPDLRQDRAFRFVTLIFMQHDCEVELIQHDDDILIERLIA